MVIIPLKADKLLNHIDNWVPVALVIGSYLFFVSEKIINLFIAEKEEEGGSEK